MKNSRKIFSHHHPPYTTPKNPPTRRGDTGGTPIGGEALRGGGRGLSPFPSRECPYYFFVVSTPVVVVVDTTVVSTVRVSTTTTVESTAVTVPSGPDPHDVKPTKAIDKIMIIFFI